MTLNEYRALFIATIMVLILIVASPILAFVLPSLKGEGFSELWILGPDHMIESYPFNIRHNETYKIFVGVGNYFGSSSYYLVSVKFRNQTEPSPNSTGVAPSPLPSLYEYRLFIRDNGIWEEPLTFSFSQVSFSESRSLVETLAINNMTFIVDKLAIWDSENAGYYYQLFIELWIYNIESDSFQFHNRSVWIWLNVTSP